MAKIKDELAAVPVGRQQRYQLRAYRDSRCILCKQPAVEGTKFCDYHLVAKRVYQRNYRRRHRLTPLREGEIEAPPTRESAASLVNDRRSAGTPVRRNQTESQ